MAAADAAKVTPYGAGRRQQRFGKIVAVLLRTAANRQHWFDNVPGPVLPLIMCRRRRGRGEISHAAVLTDGKP
jgi:hypothetical protein